MVDPGFQARVAAITELTGEIRCLALERVDGASLPAFTPGAHIDLHLGAGLVRQYSLCNGPGDLAQYHVAVKREPQSRGGSEAVHRLEVGATLQVSGPRNHFPLAANASEHLLLAGGIGVTPLLSMARHLRADGKPFRLEYFARAPQYAAFAGELEGADWRGHVALRYGMEPLQLRAHLEALLSVTAPSTHVYICGPAPFMQLAIEIASRSRPREAVHYEYFAADPDAQAGPRTSFLVRCAKSGRDLEVSEGESIVDVLMRNGIRVEVMCEQGVCGTCLTGVLEGRPDHRDAFLTDEERAAGDRMLVCCSRSYDPVLVLDL